MALHCYNRGCGEKFDPHKNKDDSCVFHPGVPIFHDALKGWSCCKKRTTDFSEFLSIKGCTRGRHSNEKPQEPLQPEVSSDKGQNKLTNGAEIIYQGPKSAEALQRERPSLDEPRVKLPHKTSPSLDQILQKLDLSKKQEQEKKESEGVTSGTRCKNAGCKTMYQNADTDKETCTYHPGGPVFHEGYKYWSCCCIKTLDFNAFLDQKGCSTGKHCWVRKQDKKKVACRHDWHQTGNTVVVTIYAKNAHPKFSTVEANGTVLFCQIQFESDKIFKREFHLWGVVDVKQSGINYVPSKVEIVLRKADPLSWGKLEDPNYKPEPEPEDLDLEQEQEQPDWDIEDDDISDSDEEWGNDNKKDKKKKSEEPPAKKSDEDDLREKLEEMQRIQMAQVQADMKKAMEKRKKDEEEREKQKELDAQEGYDDMPDLED
ncbi:cysteine and histidine-rich domain-containing protein 1 [Periophthalmus magnuspinnatus]|uniref:cysteine and histidine-rich domain-containing protein 1 n=1 Tax=Periophthalmus magnuspinnatus TaxID=409849 RepID=UPI00145B5626|nr:cysteine and histidine-rich domain-containing protein 1 [Periophthalmus magnuspinnatus]